jgi:hypothetical protein
MPVPQTAPSSRIRTTITKETLNDPASDDAKSTPFYDRDWQDVMAALSPADWKEHVARVYRSNEKWDKGASPIDNVFGATFTEDDIRQRFGGGRYLIWLYGPPKKQTLVGRYQFELEGMPIIGQSIPRVPNGAAPADGNVAIQALQMVSNPQIMQSMFQMFNLAMQESIQMIRAQMPAQRDPLETLKNAKEILGPPANAGGGLIDTIRLLKEIGVIGSPEKKGIDELLSLITTLKGSGLISAGAPKADLMTTFATNIPMLADRIVTGFQELRLKTESEERMFAIQRGQTIDVKPSAVQTDPPAAPGATAPPATPSAPSTAALDPKLVQAILVQEKMSRLVAGIKQPDSTGQDMYDYLLNAWPEVLDELAKLDVQTLLMFFKSREMQMQQLGCDLLFEVAEDPRLPKMLEDFLRIAKENASEPVAA